METILSATEKKPGLSPQAVKELVCELCRNFYHLGWASGTGGGISIKEGGKIYMAPSGVQKERLSPEDIFTLDEEGAVTEEPGRGLKLSQCSPLFMHAYKIRNAGAVLHSHSLNAVSVTLLFDKQFRIKNMEMEKGLEGFGAFDTLEVPIIENTAYECDLADSLEEAIRNHPKSHAVLVRRHGVYVWGKDWKQAKTHAECYDYLFEAACRMKQLGIDPAR
ncbi:MAG TPA: methylthioribulose 1-phosphate dehydratase [bacterium]|nr:methylthioribulose 1-phosphate dehydratase [bacterium]